MGTAGAVQEVPPTLERQNLGPRVEVLHSARLTNTTYRAATTGSAGGVGTAGAVPEMPPTLEHAWLAVERRHRTDAVRRAIHALGAQRALIFMNFHQRLKACPQTLSAALICMQQEGLCIGSAPSHVVRHVTGPAYLSSGTCVNTLIMQAAEGGMNWKCCACCSSGAPHVLTLSVRAGHGVQAPGQRPGCELPQRRHGQAGAPFSSMSSPIVWGAIVHAQSR